MNDELQLRVRSGPGRRGAWINRGRTWLARAAGVFALAAAFAAALPAAHAVTVTPPTLPPGSAGSSYSVTLTPGGGVAPYVFSNEVGRLPNGLSLTPAGLLSGVPMPATVPFEIWVTDADGREAKVTAGTNLITAPLVVSATPLPPATVQVTYTTLLPVSGGLPPYSCAISGGALPPGLSLSSGCVITGSPQASGIYGFTVLVTDQNGNMATVSYLLDVLSGVIPTLNGFTLLMLAILLGVVAAAAASRRRRSRI